MSDSSSANTWPSTCGRRGALQQDAAGDVEDGAAEAGDGEQREGADDRREDAEHGEGERRREDAGDERRRQAAARHERRRDRDADEPAGAEGRVEVAGAGLAHAERGDGEHHVEHVERAHEDVLRADDADERARRRHAPHGGDALAHLGRERHPSPRSFSGRGPGMPSDEERAGRA